MMYNLFHNHHIRPDVFWGLSNGDRQMLMAFSDFEVTEENRIIKEVGKNRG